VEVEFSLETPVETGNEGELRVALKLVLCPLLEHRLELLLDLGMRLPQDLHVLLLELPRGHFQAKRLPAVVHACVQQLKTTSVSDAR
jgi:hypothetical protein